MNSYQAAHCAASGMSLGEGMSGGHGLGPTGVIGSVVFLAAGDDLQAAINAAQLGDTIVLAAGASYSGSFYYPVKTGTGTLTIASGGAIPASGTRVSPATLGEMATIRAVAGGDPALQVRAGAHDLTIVGVHFPGNPGGFGEIVAIGSGDGAVQNQLAQVPSRIALERCYIHGDPTAGQKRGVGLNGADVTVRDCYISDCKAVGQDSQAIAGWNGPGPFLITNNYLEGAAENFMLGGADAAIPNLVPSDLTFTFNLCSKPVAWRSESWSVKNIFELKNAQRCTITNNIFEYVWPPGQDGYAVQLTPRNSDGGNTWTIVKDVEFAYNTIRHCSSGINILGSDDLHPSQLTTNLNIHHNLLSDISVANWGGGGRFVQIGAGADRVTLNHNTCIHDGASGLYAYGAPMTAFVFTNNILFDNLYGIFGDSSSPGNVAIAQYFPASTFVKNIVVAAPSGSFPANNYYPVDVAAVGFTDYAGGDYTLTPASAYHLGASDSTDPGR